MKRISQPRQLLQEHPGDAGQPASRQTGMGIKRVQHRLMDTLLQKGL